MNRLVIGALALVSAGGAAAIAWSMKGGSSMDPVRQRVVDIAQGAIGLNATDRAREFEDFLGGPGETDTMKQAMALAPQSSTCELTARAVLREAGFTHPSLLAPYAIGSGIEPIYEWAKSKGAWIEGTPGNFPNAGDIVGGNFPQASAHVWILTAADPSTGTFTSVDGGAIDARGHQSVATRTRTWSYQGNQIIDTPNMGNQHVVTGWIDVAKLAAAEGIS